MLALSLRREIPQPTSILLGRNLRRNNSDKALEEAEGTGRKRNRLKKI